VASTRASGGAQQAVDGIRDALGHVIADAGAEHDEEDRGEQDPAIELFDLGLRLLLARGERNGQDRFAALEVHRRRGDQVFEPAGALVAHVRRPPVDEDRAIDLTGRAAWQEARRKQVSLARREQARAVEDVDVLRRHAAQPDD